MDVPRTFVPTCRLGHKFYLPQIYELCAAAQDTVPYLPKGLTNMVRGERHASRGNNELAAKSCKLPLSLSLPEEHLLRLSR